MLRFYRACIWLPILLPVLPVIGLRWFAVSPPMPWAGPFYFLALSLLFGGIPYAVFATWATWRVGRLDERRIRKLALQAPFLTLLPFLPFALMIGVVGDDDVRGGLIFFGIGGLYILALGYCYVVVVLLLARLAAPHLRPIDGGAVPARGR